MPFQLGAVSRRAVAFRSGAHCAEKDIVPSHRVISADTNAKSEFERTRRHIAWSGEDVQKDDLVKSKRKVISSSQYLL